MRTILTILKKGRWVAPRPVPQDRQRSLYDLVIEATDESGPQGLPAVSVAHYGKQNGDAMRALEMCFELGFLSGPDLHPYYRNDYVGVEQWSRNIVRSHYVHLVQLHEQHERFAKTWDNTLRLQGFAETFDPQKHVRG